MCNIGFDMKYRAVLTLQPLRRASSTLNWLILIGLLTVFAWTPVRSPYDSSQDQKPDALTDGLNDAKEMQPLNNRPRKQTCPLNTTAPCPGSQDPKGYDATTMR